MDNCVSSFNCQRLVKTHRLRACKMKHQLKLASDNATMALLGDLDNSKATDLRFIQVVHIMQCVWYNEWIMASGTCFQKLQLLVASVVYSHAQFIDFCCTINTTLSPSTCFWSKMQKHWMGMWFRILLGSTKPIYNQKQYTEINSMVLWWKTMALGEAFINENGCCRLKV